MIPACMEGPYPELSTPACAAGRRCKQHRRRRLRFLGRAALNQNPLKKVRVTLFTYSLAAMTP